jgi:glucose-1-phosphate thymidylyltransferase
LQSGRTIDAIGLDGWRMDIGYPEDRDEAETRLQNADTGAPVEAATDA